MEAFFGHTDLAQMVAFPIEIIGLTLVILELFYPDRADNIEKLLDRYSLRKNWISLYEKRPRLFTAIQLSVIVLQSMPAL